MSTECKRLYFSSLVALSQQAINRFMLKSQPAMLLMYKTLQCGVVLRYLRTPNPGAGEQSQHPTPPLPASTPDLPLSAISFLGCPRQHNVDGIAPFTIPLAVSKSVKPWETLARETGLFQA